MSRGDPQRVMVRHGLTLTYFCSMHSLAALQPVEVKLLIKYLCYTRVETSLISFWKLLGVR